MGISDEQPRVRPLALRIVRAFFYWVWWLYVYICVTVVTGALVGAFLFVAVGALTHPEMDVLRRAEMGLTDGFYYAGMWSGGLAIVLCVMRAHRRRHQHGDKKSAQTAPIRFEVAGQEAPVPAPSPAASSPAPATGDADAGSPEDTTDSNASFR